MNVVCRRSVMLDPRRSEIRPHFHEEPAMPRATDFIRSRVANDLGSGAVKSVRTRFPPEPNGFLHLGHAKSIVLNFGIALEFGGICHLRLDDTNPSKESQDFVDAIQRDVEWLGYDWRPYLFFASDNFAQLYDWAVHLIETGNAYVDEQSVDEVRLSRGTLTQPGIPSPYRDRPIAESLEMFVRMRRGEFAEGKCVLRAKIDMAAGNVNLRDPVLYRISRVPHPRTGTVWCIYPSYDFAHGQSDAIEGITHSIATLEFADHKALYDWLLERLPVPSRPRQYEFARLEMTHTVLSKRILTSLVTEGVVDGWDDPRLPTLAGLRRRGVPADAIREFIMRIGVSKANSVVDIELFEGVIREVLNQRAERRMAVLRPLELVLQNLDEGAEEVVAALNHPEHPERGSRSIRLRRRLFIERDDFAEEPPKGFNRLAPGKEVRLRYAFVVRCAGVERDSEGRVVRVLCTYDPATRGGQTPDGRKVKGTIHWVDAETSVTAEIRVIGRLLAYPQPDTRRLSEQLSGNSLEVISGCRAEPSVADWATNAPLQFERQGYFVRDAGSDGLAFNRTIGLRDSWPAKSG